MNVNERGGGKHLAAGDHPTALPARPPVFKRALIALCILLAGGISLVAGMSVAQHRPFWQIVASAFTPSPQQLFGKNHILVLVEGLDYDYNSLDEEYSAKARSDVIWAVNLDFDTHHIYQLSIPRDMAATYPDGSRQKINQAQSDGGIKESQAVIANFLGIPAFDRYLVFRVNTTKDLLTALGGVDVKVENSDCLMHPHGCVNGPLDYDDTWGHLHIHLKPGFQHLSGEQAVGYMRFRHDWCSDPCRIMRQQQVLDALVRKLSANKLNTLLHMNQLIGVLNKDVDTNFTQQEEFSIATALSDISPKAVVKAQVPYTDEVVLADGGAAILPDAQKRAQLVRSMLLAPPKPSIPPDPGTLAAVSPATVRVVVENGTNVPGMARRVADILRREGFQIADVGNTPTPNVATTEVHQHSRVANAGLKVRAALGVAAKDVPVISETADNTSDVTIILGEDLVTAFNTPTQ